MKFYLHHYKSKHGYKIMLEYHNVRVGGRFIYSTGINISSSDWDKKRNWPKVSSDNFDQLDEKLLDIRKKITDFVKRPDSVNADLLRAHLNEDKATEELDNITQPRPIAPTVLELWENYLKLKKPTVSADSHTSYTRSKNYFADFLKPLKKDKIKPEHFTYTLLQEYHGHLITEKKFSLNNVSKALKHLSMFYGDILKSGYKFDFNRDDIVYGDEAGRKISLTWEQVVDISKLDVTGRLERIRDVMLIQCSTGLRISDLFRFSRNITNDTLVLQQEKTGNKTVVPLNNMVKDILKKYNNNPPKYSEKEYRLGIKDVYKKIDPHSMIQIRNKDGVFEDRYVHEEISSHDLVRTFITISAKKGMPVPYIARIVGKSERVIYRHYLNVTDQAAREEFLKAWND